jgi:hypothetical protein
MTRSLKRARVEQKTKVLQLLTLSGAIRPADVEARYRGSDMLIGMTARQQAEAARQQDSIWWMDLTALLKAFQARQIADRSRRALLIDQRASHRATLKPPAAPGTA